MLLIKQKIIIFLCIIILLLVFSICIYFVINDSNKNNNNYKNNNYKNNKDNFTSVTSPNYDYLGCYKDNVARALPNYLGTANTADKCYNMAKPNYDLFGLQAGSECWVGNSNDSNTDYKKHGLQSNNFCQNIFGGAWTNQVYQIKPSPTLNNTSMLFKNVNVSDPWIVPDGVTQAFFTVIGGCGYGISSNNENLGGNGAKVVALVNVIPGDAYNIFVGGNGNQKKGGLNFMGFNGSNGTGTEGQKYISEGGGGGGAATCVYNNTTPIIIAGGGGGCPNLTRVRTGSSNTGGSGGINKRGDGGNGSNTTLQLGGPGGPNISSYTISGQQLNNAENSGGAGGGSNGGRMGGNFSSGGAGGSYVNPEYSGNYEFSTNVDGITSVLIDWSTPNYYYKGCYNDKTIRALPRKISANVNVESVDECYDLAKFNYDLFGLQNGGECWVGNKAKDDYAKYGYSNLATCDILGNRLTNQVYEVYKAPTTTKPNVFATSENYKYKGCYSDDLDNPALPQYYDTTANSVDDCYNMMKDDNKYDIFALQYGGECWAGNKTTDSYDKYGKMPSNCDNILGNLKKNQVYEIIRKPTTTKAPTTTKPQRTRRATAITDPLITVSETEILPDIAINLIDSRQILNNIKKL
jgi:cbb3-type cytochrome oxidase subunit 3